MFASGAGAGDPTPAARPATKSKTSNRKYTGVPTFADSTKDDVTQFDDAVVREAAVRALGRYNGSVVAIDPTTGRILTIVNQRLAFSAGFIPCSTIKPTIALAALQESVITRDSMIRVAPRRYMNLTEAMAHSNNTFFEELGRRMGFETVEKYAHTLGLGELAGIDIPEEQAGVLPAAPPARGGVLFAHWEWSGGFLTQLGLNYGLGRGFLDASGSGAIQAAGGLTALSIAWILGPRRGKFTADNMPVAIPGHNAVLMLFGCLLVWFGWLGLNSAGALLHGVPFLRAPLIPLNTTLSAVCASLAAAAITRVRFGKPDASLCANGWVAGLAASSAACASVRPALAMIIGSVAGALVVFSVEWLEFRLGIDDPGGAVSVHALGGIWGILALGIFSAAPGQWLAQFVGVAVLLGFILPLAYSLNWLLGRAYSHRVAPQGERQGLDLHELGAGADPEFHESQRRPLAALVGAAPLTDRREAA